MQIQTPTEQIMLWVTAWMLAAVPGTIITFVRHHRRNAWDILAVGCLSGFVAVSVLHFVVWISGGDYASYLFLAVALGLLGEDSFVFARLVVHATFRHFGFDTDTMGRSKDAKNRIERGGDGKPDDHDGSD